MKHLSNFIRYITESTDLTEDDLKDILIAFDDMGIEYDVRDPKLIATGKYEGRISRSIFFTNNFNKENLYHISTDSEICDDKYWEFLDELITMKNRIGSDVVSISMNKHYIIFTYLENKRVDVDPIVKLQQEIRKRYNSGRSDFHNSITSLIENGSLVVKVSSYYTRRKWNLLVRGLDFSKFNVEFDEDIDDDDRYSDVPSLNNSAEIKITPKK